MEKHRQAVAKYLALQTCGLYVQEEILCSTAIEMIVLANECLLPNSKIFCFRVIYRYYMYMIVVCPI